MRGLIAPANVLDPQSPDAGETWRPTAFISLRAPAVRTAVHRALERAGWAVIEHATGFHLLQAIAGLIDGRPTWCRPGLIVVDAWSPGCAGVSLAAGLRELGIAIPVVVVSATEAVPGAYAVDADSAPQLVGALARRLRRGPLAPLESGLIAHPRKEETPYDASYS